MIHPEETCLEKHGCSWNDCKTSSLLEVLTNLRSIRDSNWLL